MPLLVGLNKTLRRVTAHDDGLVIIPFSFQINGTSDPDNVKGDMISRTVTRSEAGEFVVTLKARPAYCFYGQCDVSTTADDVDIFGKVDWSTVESAGTFTVRLMTGAVQTDPTDNLYVGGFLLCKRTSRARTGAT